MSISGNGRYVAHSESADLSLDGRAVVFSSRASNRRKRHQPQSDVFLRYR